jgi:hypothetical protein
MKKVSQRLWIILLVLASFVLVQACATAPKLPEPKPGLYVNEEFRFSIQYPEHWVSDKMQQDSEVLRVVNTNEWKIPSLVVNVDDLEEEADLKNAAQAYIDAVKESNPGTKRFKILSEEMVKLNDGTPAVALTFKWNWIDGVTKLQSGVLVVYKEKKVFSAIGTTILGGDTTPEMLRDMAATMKFY